MAKTLYDKIWQAHVVTQINAQTDLLYIDRHLVHEVTSPQAFAGLREHGRKVRCPDKTFATMDHNVSTKSRSLDAASDVSRNQLMALAKNCEEFGITLYDFNDEQELQQVRMAKRAIYQRSYWQMEGVVDVFIHPERTELRRTGTAEWHTNLSPQSLAVVMVQPRDMSISDLYSYTRYLQQQGLDADSYLLSFWRKVTQPLGTFALVILGISFIFGPLRSVTPGYRIFSGILVGLIYKYSEDLLAPASILFGIDPIWASILPISGCLLAGIIVMRRAG